MSFDPYLAWLQISPDERPIHHYLLLGLPPFEQDSELIRAAADRRMMEVRRQQTGPRGAYTQRVLNELAAAKLCLLNPESKARYDELLRRSLGATAVDELLPPEAGDLPPEADVLPPMAEESFSSECAAPPVAVVGPASSAANLSANAPGTPRMDSPTGPSRSVVASLPGDPIAGLRLAPPARVARRRSTRWAVPVACIALSAISLMIATYVVVVYVVPAGSGTPAGSGNQAASGAEISAAAAGNSRPRTSPTGPTVSDRQWIAQEASGAIHLTAGNARLDSQSLNLETAENGQSVIVGWTSPEDEVHWDFRVVRPGFFKLEIRYSVQNPSQATGYYLALDDEPVEAFETRGAAGTLVTDEHMIAIRRSGPHVLAMAIELAGKQHGFRLHGIHLTPQNNR